MRLRVDCNGSTSFCAELLVALASRSRKSIEQQLSITRVRLAQCFAVAWQEVNGGILLWADNPNVELVKHEYELPTRRLRRLERAPAFSREPGEAIVMPGL